MRSTPSLARAHLTLPGTAFLGVGAHRGLRAPARAEATNSPTATALGDEPHTHRLVWLLTLAVFVNFLALSIFSPLSPSARSSRCWRATWASA